MQCLQVKEIIKRIRSWVLKHRLRSGGIIKTGAIARHEWMKGKKDVVYKFKKVQARLRGAIALVSDDDHIIDLNINEESEKGGGLEGRQKKEGESRQEVEQGDKGRAIHNQKIIKFVAIWL